MSNIPNEKICPFCKGKNNCMAHSKNPCWCNDIEIPAQLINLVPSHLKRKSCICLSCINAFKENPTNFKLAHSLNQS